MTETDADSIEEIITKFEASGRRDQKTELRVLSLAVPAEYKKKFDRLQLETDKEFGEMLKRVLMRTIDRVAPPESQAG